MSSESDRQILEGARLQALKMAGCMGFGGLDKHIAVHEVDNSPLPDAPTAPCLSYSVTPWEKNEAGVIDGQGANIYLLRDPVGDKRFTVYAVAFDEDNRFFELPISFEAYATGAMKILGLQVALCIAELHLSSMNEQGECAPKFLLGEFHQHWDD